MQVLTAGLKGKLLQGRSAGGEIWRRSATELGEVGVGVALRASRSHCQAQCVPVEALRGSGRTEAHRRRGIEVAEVFTGGGPPGGKPALHEGVRSALPGLRGLLGVRLPVDVPVAPCSAPESFYRILYFASAVSDIFVINLINNIRTRFIISFT